MNDASAAAPIAPPARALDDRLNPILVKEVRQSLRGRYFRALFWLTLGTATLVGLSVIARSGSVRALDVSGEAYFMVMFACMSAAVHAFTPFSAFLSMSAEWDEHTQELLVLSNLRPRQIILGKLQSALIQALLYYSTFGPFLVFAFLLNGVDLLAIVVILCASMAFCITLSLAGIALASLTAAKPLRIALMAAFGGGLVFAWGLSLAAASAVVRSPESLRASGAVLAIAAFLTCALLLSAFLATIAAGQLAHEEENRASGVRALSVVVVLVATGWGAYLNASLHESEAVWGVQLAAMAPLLPLWILSLTEAEGLGRRMAKHLPRNPALALLAAAFLPGGGRAALLMLLHTVLALVGAAFALAFHPPSRNDFFETLAVIGVAYAYAWMFLAVPAAIASRLVSGPRGRVIARMTIAALLPTAIIAPTVIGLVLGVRGWREFEHPLNPLWAIDRATRSSGSAGVLTGLVLLFGVVAVLINAPRMWIGVSEVQRAALARRKAPAPDA